MLEISELKLPVDHAPEEIARSVAVLLKAPHGEVLEVKTHKRAIDARKGRVLLSYTLHVTVRDEAAALAHYRSEMARVQALPERRYGELAGVIVRDSAPDSRPVVVGTGPCGLFCALLLARHGWKPVVLERGKAAGPRARDVTGFWRRGLEFDPESNVQFGEGGAGTFSDGKLYTQIRDREHRIPWILQEMVRAGAPEDILIKARPHIGTDRLIKVVRHVREEIQSLGGEVRFETMMEALLLRDGRVAGVRLRGGEEIAADTVVLAVGHSARPTFEMLHGAGVFMEAKPLSIGVRVEHPQKLIDQTQYGKWAGHALLGAAPYKFAHHCRTGRAAYSFCMCPGGLVVAASSEPGGVVTNGMSSYARAEANANSGFMVDVSPQDYGGSGPLAGIAFQRHWEQRAFAAGGGGYRAPVQTIGDFLSGRPTKELGSVPCSYQPGVTPGDLRECLPPWVVATLKEAIPAVDRTLRGFALPDGVLVGVETRSSSPLRITRDPATLQSVSTPGLYPAGEGAGYAGGIISAAVDGMRVAECLLKSRQ
jgi:uncharacterized FAD-dependent dehydrogenase